MWRRCRSSNNNNSNNTIILSLDEILVKLGATLFVTGCFCVAWSWDLVAYGASHAWRTENPLQNQLSFGTFNQHAPKYLIVLILQYVMVCAGAARLSSWCTSNERNQTYSAAAITAVEFFPSPVFAGKLLAYLSQFGGRSSSSHLTETALLNFVATYGCALCAHVLPTWFGYVHSFLERYRLQRFPNILQNSLGFGLGIAWNLLLLQVFGVTKRQQQSSDDTNLWSTLGLAGYLAVITLLAFRIAALVKEEPPETVWDRHLQLLLFSSTVVCAFTLVAFLNVILHPGWLGNVEALWILLVLSATMSALVGQVNLEHGAGNNPDDEVKCGNLREGPFGLLLCVLMFVPCTWCCCPWVPVLWLLADNTNNAMGVKSHWYKLISMIAGLASSIEASSMLTATTNAVAAGFCTADHCKHRWLFVGLQVVVALVTTIVLIPAVAPFAGPPDTEQPLTDEETPRGERQSLLRRVRDSFRRTDT